MPQHKDLTGIELHEPRGVDVASIGKVYVADGAGSGSWSKSTGTYVDIGDVGGYFSGTTVELALQEIGLVANTYGVLSVTTNATAQTPTGSGTYDVWDTGWSNGALGSGITQTAANGSLTVTNAGIYQINVDLSFKQGGATAATWLFALAVNGAENLTTKQGFDSSLTNTRSVGISTILSLSAADIITLEVARVTGTETALVSDATFMVNRLI